MAVESLREGNQYVTTDAEAATAAWTLKQAQNRESLDLAREGRVRAAQQSAADAVAQLGAVRQEAAGARTAAQQSAASAAASRNAAEDAQGTADRFGDDIELLKQMAQIEPGSVVDAQTAILVQDPESETHARLNAQTVERGMPTADDGHQYVWLAGVIRNTGDGNGWQLLPEDTNHRPVGITSIETVDDGNGRTGLIRVNYPGAVGAEGMTVAFLAVPDEQLGQYGFTIGTSVTQTYTEIRIGQALPSFNDYVYYDGSEWVSYRGTFTDITFANGLLTLNHPSIPAVSESALSITPRHPSYQYTVSENANSLNSGRVVLAIREDSPELADMISFNGTAWSSQSGVFTGITWNGSTGVLHLEHPTQTPAETQALSLSSRGAYDARVSQTTNPNATGHLDVQFYNAGTLVTGTPPSGLSLYVRKGVSRGTRPATTPVTQMKFYISHGGGQRAVKPSELDTIDYPSSNIWLYGIMGRD